MESDEAVLKRIRLIITAHLNKKHGHLDEAERKRKHDEMVAKFKAALERKKSERAAAAEKEAKRVALTEKFRATVAARREAAEKEKRRAELSEKFKAAVAARRAAKAPKEKKPAEPGEDIILTLDDLRAYFKELGEWFAFQKRTKEATKEWLEKNVPEFKNMLEEEKRLRAKKNAEYSKIERQERIHDSLLEKRAKHEKFMYSKNKATKEKHEADFEKYKAAADRVFEVLRTLYQEHNKTKAEHSTLDKRIREIESEAYKNA